jgi:hypothetical protein
METLESHPDPLAALRRFLLLIIVLSLLATAAELLLVGHTEDAWQWAPLVLVGLGLIVAAWLAAAPQAAALRAWQGLMALFIVGGLAGFYLHGTAKMEFTRESNPSASEWSVFWAALKTQSPPTLAPGVLIQAGLLGLAYTLRHPAFIRTARSKSAATGEER